MSSAAAHLDEPFVMPTAESLRRLIQYLNASSASNSSEFNGLMLMSLMCYVSDEIWSEAISDALRTLSQGAS